jgi:ribosome biogenesis GTPase A
MQQKGIHWFPGHMKKALRQIEERLKLIDVIVEIVDARCPISSKNQYLEEITKNKNRVIVFSKKDLTSNEEIKPFEEYYKERGYYPVVCDLNSPSDVNLIKKAIAIQGKSTTDRYIRRGMKPQPLRAMIIGIPNVGKSTLINRLSKSSSMSVANTPGHTRSQQWIKVDKTLDLLDTPGILPPSYEDKIKALHLALTGAMKVENIAESELSSYLLEVLVNKYPSALKERYALTDEELANEELIFKGIARRRGLLLPQNELDVNKAELLLLKEFKEGLIVKLVLDQLC